MSISIQTNKALFSIQTNNALLVWIEMDIFLLFEIKNYEPYGYGKMNFVVLS